MATRIVALALFALSLGPLGAGNAGSTAMSTHFVAHLNAAQMAHIHSTRGVPANASGLLTATLTGGTLTFTLTWAHLTSRVEHADVMLHTTPRKLGSTLFLVCVSPYCHPPTAGTAHWPTWTLGVVRHWLLTGKMFATISTTRNPHGEIGGPLRPVALKAA